LNVCVRKGSLQPNSILLITGSELTRGETQDLNGPFLATELTSLGLRVDEILLAPDDPRLLAESLREAIRKATVVIFSGGLGPTADDHTVKVVAEVFGRRVIRHAEAEARMRARALSRGLREDQIPPNYYKQAEVVEGAEVLLNPAGLAPGMLLPTEIGVLAVLPGVPRELQAMFRELVLPALAGRLRLEPPRILRAKVLGQGESWVEARVQKLGLDFTAIEYGISAKPGEILLKFISHRPKTHDLLDRARSLLESEFGADIIVLPEGLLDASGTRVVTEHAAIVHGLLLEAGATLATAESCTGGLIAKSITDHPGSSSYFLGSIVAYDDRVKEKLLGVPRALLDARGAVSEDVCRAMARGAREVFGATLALSVTGIAGPGGATPDKPVGLVFIGLADDGPGWEARIRVERHLFWGSRENVRALATTRALDLIRRHLAATPGASRPVDTAP
jgi:nicotinamide-nucleotide amidase